MRIQRFGKFYKYSPKSLELLALIDNNRHLLTEELYNIPEALLYNRKGEYLGFAAPLLYGYYTLAQHLQVRYPLDKDKISASLIQVLEELESIGIIYFDIHDQNIMIGMEEEVKLVDLDGAKITGSFRYKKHMLYNFWELMFEMYVLPSYDEIPSIIKIIRETGIFKEYFSKEFLEYITEVIFVRQDIRDVPLGTYLGELKDQEKMLRLRNEIKDISYHGP